MFTGLSREYLNVLVNSRIPGIKSLRCIDDICWELFYDDAPPRRDGGRASADAARRWLSNLETIRLPTPSFTFRPGDSDDMDDWKIHCFPLAERKVVCVDQSGRGFIVHADGDTSVLGCMPALRKSKRMPFSLPIHCPGDDDARPGGSSLYIMERFPQHGDQFELLINRFLNNDPSYRQKFWQCDPLPSPPFIRKTKPRNGENITGLEVTAYAVVGGGSHICVSVEGAGTYWMDTAESHTWTQVGEWTLPFSGKVEHVPELNLWFGLAADAKALAAADLSPMGCRPRLVGPWKELHDGTPEECQDPQIVNLGSGRFCIARFFRAAAKDADEDFVVLTGVEVAWNGDDGEMELKMTKHMSRRLSNTDGATIEAVF
ncbi:hypothetical protein HU200_051936 [Digitaria exilis]|uniref:Uncharacterized protein n=1 Tax=Digitaria exilis TaxID=1010633 RepID=A0A835APN4_9POAL|nr:hypothetical protein HU200_051936 [Digitaria exilis]